MKHINNKFSIKVALFFAAITVLFIGSCKKPTDGVTIAVNTSIIKYSALINFVDAADGKTVPQNIKIKISGASSGSVYNIAGQKDFTVSSGQIDVGLHPSLVPTTSKPVTFNLEISADNCLPVTQQVTIMPKQFFQTLTVKVLNLSSPPAGVKITTLQVDASSGKLTTQQAAKIGTGSAGSTGVEYKDVNDVSKQTNDVYADDALTSVVLPAGTSFYYDTYKDTVISVKVLKRTYGTPVTLASSTANTANPLDGLTFSGVNITTSGGGSVDLTYTPYTDYYADENITEYIPVKNVYKGKVNVVCIYIPGQSVTSSYSVFSNNNFTPNNITLLNKQTSPEDELLFNSAVKQKLNYLYFVGTVNGQSVNISPDATALWKTSYALDPNFINAATGKKIAVGDSIESGIDYVHKKTLHTAVLKTAGGQLRAECRTQNVGSYTRAAYTQSYSYNFNTNVDALTIPDPENLSGYYYISCGQAGGYYGGYIPNSGTQVQSGKICAATPITASATYYSRYFDQTQTKTIASGSSADVFSGWSNLKPLVSFDVSLICNVGTTTNTIKPTYSTGLTSPLNGSFVFKSIDGYWATRGLTPGQSLSYTVYLSKGTVSFTKNSIAQGVNAVTITYTGSANTFCKIL